MIAALALKPGDFVGLTAGKLLTAQKTAGVLRKLLGAASEKHMKQNAYEFCWIVDFPMYEIGEESGESWSSVTIHSLCHRVEWMLS